MKKNGSRKNLMVSISMAPSPMNGVPSLVESVAFGSDGLKYCRLDVASQLDRFNDPVWFHALADDKLVGVYVLDRRNLLVNGQAVTGFYRGVLAVDTHWQGQGVGRQMVEAAMQWMKALSQNDQFAGQPVVSYGCIDKSNKRSLQVLQSTGAAAGPELRMYMMYRQWPRKACELIALNDSHEGELKALADELYSDCTVRDVSPSRLPGMVLQDEHGIVVSARVAVTAFRILEMGAMASLCTRLFVRPFASARRRFNQESFCYVSFSDVVVRPGCESLWPRFVTTVLARHDCHFGAVYVDPRNALFRRLQKSSVFSPLLHSSDGGISVVLQVFGAKNSSLLNDMESGVHLWPVDA